MADSHKPGCCDDMVRFLYHELKTPVFIFKTLICMLKEGEFPEEAYLDEMLLECEKYEGIITYVLQRGDDLPSIDEIKSWKEAWKYRIGKIQAG